MTRKQLVVSFSGMTAREKDEGVMILPMDSATQHEMSCLTKHLYGGFRKKKKKRATWLKRNYKSNKGMGCQNLPKPEKIWRFWWTKGWWYQAWWGTKLW